MRELLRTIQSDIEVRPSYLYSNANSDWGKFLLLYRRTPTFRYTFWYRCSVHFQSKKKVTYQVAKIISLLNLRRIAKKVMIYGGGKIGKGLHIVHGGNVFLNAKEIGENFTIYQGATIGADKTGKPTIKNNVTIYTNAVVCGNVVIGNNCRIGAGAFVNFDLEDDSIVINQSMIKKHTNLEER